MSEALQLNLGCGTHKIPGFINVDKFAACAPDLVCDLEAFPWPWESNSVAKVIMAHVLEHICPSAEAFLSLMQELYRVCRANAEILIMAPHPRHDDFLNDPTHVRPVTVAMFELFSRRYNLEFEQRKLANSPLALYTGTDFDIVDSVTVLDPAWEQKLVNGEINAEQVHVAIKERYNVAREVRLKLRVLK